MKVPTVSVVIPTYNRAHILGRSIRSVLNQSYQDFEVIVVDDGSTDNTEEVVHSFNSDKIQFIRHRANRGVAAARNTGVRNAKGEYIAFQDSDDEWYPNRLELISGILQDRKDIDFIICYGHIVKNGQFLGDAQRKPWINELSKDELVVRLFLGNLTGPPASVIKRDKVLAVGGFDESIPVASDYELWLRLVPICNVLYIDEPVYALDGSSARISDNISKSVKSHIYILVKNRSVLRDHVGSTARYYAVRQQCLANILAYAAWRYSVRGRGECLSFALRFLSFAVYPDIRRFALVKRILTSRQ